MDIDEAIEILELELHPAAKLSTHKSKDALKLGIEALKRYQDYCSNPEMKHWEPLPGETRSEE